MVSHDVKVTHQIEVEKAWTPRFTKWWVDCSCGWFHGAQTKKGAESIGKQHVENEASSDE